MTGVALTHLNVLLSRDLHRHHLEMHHVMARWRLVTLGAIDRVRGRVAELGDRPRPRAVALGAILPEELPVAVLVPVAGDAIEGGFTGRDARVRQNGRRAPVHESGDAIGCGPPARICRSRAPELTLAKAREKNVIHGGPADPAPLVLDVAPGALAHVRVERGRLPLQDGLVVGMARHAVRRGNTSHRRVAGRAIVFKEAVGL